MAECRYKGLCRLEFDADFDVCYPCVGDGSETCVHYEPMPDVKALTELADGIEFRAKMTIEKRGPYYGSREWLATAACIRDALGETDG